MKLLKPSSVFCAAMLAALAICASTAWAQPHIG